MDWWGVTRTRAACSVAGRPPPRCRHRAPAPRTGGSAPRAQMQPHRAGLLCGRRARDGGVNLPGNVREARSTRLSESPTGTLPCLARGSHSAFVPSCRGRPRAEGEHHVGLTWHLPCGLKASRSLTSESASWGRLFFFLFFFFLLNAGCVCVEGCVCILNTFHV